MKLSKKIFNVVTLIFIIALLVIYVLCKTILLKKFTEIEVANIELDTKRILSIINTTVTDINSLALDYGKWDATYNFMETQNSYYIETNYGENNIFEKFGVNFVLFLDKSNNVAFTKVIDDTYKTNVLLSNDNKVNLGREIASFTKKNNKFGFKGIFLISDIPMIISVQPILPTSGEGDPRGFLVLAKYLDAKEAAIIYENLAINVEFVKYNKNLLSKVDFEKNNIYVKIIDRKLISSYGLIKDLYGNPVVMSKVTHQRNIYEKAENSISFFIILVYIVGLVFLLMIFHLINKLVVKRIIAITNKVDEVSKTQDLSIRINMAGSDEVSQLGNHFDIMFSSLHKTKEQILKSIEEKRKDEEKILTLANYDTLTNLPNRKMLIDVVNNLISTPENRFALLFIDLDNFKEINDSLGHQAGDTVLQQVAIRLKEISPIKDYIFRMGGDEFIIIFNSIEEEKSAELLAKEINTILKPPFSYIDNMFYIGASIGISFYPEDGVDLHTLMKNSDTAMYEAKKTGANSYKIYSYEMNEKALSDLHRGNALRSAVKNNEFLLHYQPIIDISSSQVTGCEALVRWNHGGKIIYPGDFLNLAKTLGIMTDIDNWVLYNACSQCRKWQLKGFPDVFVSVNVSFNQLNQPGFVSLVSDIIEQLGLSPNFLNLEITEDEAMVDAELTIEILRNLKSIGVRIALDDFGAGYSSLSYVNKLPIDSLKIDRSLIQNLAQDSKNIEIIKSIIYMAKNLNINVITEGVETKSELQILKELDCHLIQGYLFSKPLNVDAFEKFINTEGKLNFK